MLVLNIISKTVNALDPPYIAVDQNFC